MKRLLQFSFFIAAILALVISCAKEEPTPESVKYTLTVSAGNGGNVSSTGGSYTAGSEVTITATPNSEYVFSGWSNGSTENPIKITVNSNQTITANFTKRKYALSITIEGEGTVTEEVISSGKDYDSGTVVRLTAVPSDNWQFTGWTGAVESTELSIDLTISEAKSLIAEFNVILNDLPFNEYGLRVQRDTVRYTPDEWNITGQTYYQAMARFHILNNGEEYFYFSSRSPDSPSITLKRIDTIWSVQNIDRDNIVWGTRNYKILDESRFVLAGSGEVQEFRPNNNDWKDHIWEVLFDGVNFEYKQISTTASYYHSIGVGDLTDDGLYDVSSGGGIFVQNQEGSFEEHNYTEEDFSNHTLLNPDRLQELQNPLESEIFDLYKGGRNELIIGFIDVSNMVTEDEIAPRGDILIYEYNESTSKYDVVYEVPQRILNRIATANDIEGSDLNGDGINDLIIEMAGNTNTVSGAWIEIWLGNSDKSFTKNDEIFLEEGNIHTTGFSLIDVNNDGKDDIILRPWRGGDSFIENWCQDDCFELEQQGIEVRSGIKLENLIYINNGKGKFNKPNFEIRLKGTITEWLKPFMRNGNLCFFGTQEHYGQGEYWDVEFVDIEIDKTIFN